MRKQQGRRKRTPICEPWVSFLKRKSCPYVARRIESRWPRSRSERMLLGSSKNGSSWPGTPQGNISSQWGGERIVELLVTKQTNKARNTTPGRTVLEQRAALPTGRWILVPCA